jgi:4-amino-4-deoxy-L-arabinose transferase-like glycosyltransferase
MLEPMNLPMFPDGQRKDSTQPEIQRQHGSSYLWVVLTLGLVIRLVFLYTTKDTRLVIVDEQHYSTLALNLLTGYGFAWKPGELTSLRPPLYPAFIALVWMSTGAESVLVVRIVQVLISLLNVYLLYRLGLLLFERRVAVLAAAGLCFYPSLVAFNFLLLTEVLFTLLLTLVALSYVTLLKTKTAWAAWSTGGVLGLAALTRSVLWPFPLVLCPLTLFTLLGSWKQRLWTTLALLLGYLVVVTPWAVRNTKLQGAFTVIDTMGGLTLRMGNYEHTDLNRAWVPITIQGENSIFQDLYREHSDVSSWTEGQKEKWALRKTLAYVQEHPGLTLKRAVVKFACFWGLERTLIAGWQYGLYQPPHWFAILGTFLVPLCYIIVMLLACLGIFLSPPANRRVHLFFLFLIGFIAGAHTLAFGHERYHLPLIPFLFLYTAAAVVQQSWRQLCGNLRKAAPPVVVCIGLLLIWGREVLVVDADRIRALLHTILG